MNNINCNTMHLDKMSTDKQKYQHCRIRKPSILSHYFPPTILPIINSPTRHKTIELASLKSSPRRSPIHASLWVTNKQYSKEQIEIIKNEAQIPVQNYQKKYYHPQGASRCSKLVLVQQKSALDRLSRIKSKSIKQERLEMEDEAASKQKNRIGGIYGTITSCSILESIIYG